MRFTPRAPTGSEFVGSALLRPNSTKALRIIMIGLLVAVCSNKPTQSEGSLPEGVDFSTVTNSVEFSPTSMVWGPDDHLYVSDFFGVIHAITFNPDGTISSQQDITTLQDAYGGGSRLALGITVDPDSTASDVILWVAHSEGSGSSDDPGIAHSSTVTRLSGEGFSDVQHVITGLPRSIANHAINSIHFSPTDGALYIAMGGITGAGVPNTAATEFGTRPEQFLSAALLRADVKAIGFQGDCADTQLDDSTGTAGKSVPANCDVEVFASGMRNMYDFVFHSSGRIYGPDNGLGVRGTVPASPNPDCQEIVEYDGQLDPLDPGTQPDILLNIRQGRYYGHPNPARDECVFKDGSFQSVAPLPNYEPPIYLIGDRTSSNGTIEYTVNNFCGQLRGDLFIANFSQGDNLLRIQLSEDGTSVSASDSFATGFDDPLPVVLGPDGTIYVGEFDQVNIATGKITALVPNDVGCWTNRASLPQSILDAGGAALNDHLYVVAGKTSAGHQSTLWIYDTTTDSWVQGADLPGSAVENPAVLAYQGKVFAFGGSTGPFSGAVTNAAVYDPATDTWTSLAAMSTGRGGPTAQVIGSQMYVVGGMDTNGASLSSVEIYTPGSNSWTAGPSMSTRRDNPGSAVLDGNLYIFGGRTRNTDGSVVDGTLSTVEMLNPVSGNWTSRAPMPTGRRTMVVGTINGKAQVIGGENPSFDATEEYDPVTNTWRLLAPMPTARHGAAGGTINGLVYVIGGGPQAGSSFTEVNKVFGFRSH